MAEERHSTNRHSGMSSIDRRKISVVIPVYNEIGTIQEILQRVSRVPLEKQIIVVDDGSTDGTREFLQGVVGTGHDPTSQLPLHTADQQGGLRVIFHDRNRGKGAALRTGFAEATGEIVIIQDADLEYDPQDYFALMQPIEQGYADVVFGSRFHGGPHRVLYFWHYVANRFLTLLSNVFTNLNLSDIWTCYKVFRREVVQGLELKENGFGVEVEVTARIAKGKWRIYEVPIAYHGRTYDEGKKITWRDGVRALGQIVRYGVFS